MYWHVVLHWRPTDKYIIGVHLPDGSTFLGEMMSWPPSWKCDVRSKIWFRNRCLFTRRTVLPNFVQFWFEMGGIRLFGSGWI